MPLNFYELYNLINENTVSQELKNLRKKNPAINDYIIKAKKELKAAFLYLDVNDKSLEVLAKWIINSFEKGAVKFSESFLKFVVSNLKNNFKDFFAYSLGPDKNFNPTLLNKFNNPSFQYEDLEQLNDKYHDDLKKGSIRIPGKQGKTILSFPDGYSWVDVEQGSCDVEAKSMGHCGNSGAFPGDTILSLRDNKNIPHLTFILNDGMLTERKGRANTKPKEKYHPYIIELLKSPMIKGLSAGRYLPENDFQLTDLKKEDLENLIKFKPKMQNYLYLSMLLAGEDLPEEDIEKLIKDSDIETDSKIAQVKKISSKLLKIIYNKYKNSINDPRDNGIEVINNIVGNPNAPAELLIKLAKEDGYKSDLSYFISLNPNAPKELLSDMFLKGRDTVLQNPNVPEKILRQTVDHAESSEATPSPSIQNRLVKIASNTNCPSDILDKLSSIGKFSVKLQVIRNKNTSIETLNKMTNDFSKDENERRKIDGYPTISSLAKEMLNRRLK